MAAIMTGPHGILAYFDAKPAGKDARAFGLKGDFHRQLDCSFAALPAFTCNSNHPPSDLEGSISWDAGLDLLFRIADAR